MMFGILIVVIRVVLLLLVSFVSGA